MKISTKAILFVLVLVIATSKAFSQTIISGVVTNRFNSEGIEGASVKIKNTGIGLMTDNFGRFRIRVNRPLPIILVISSVGFRNQEVTVLDNNQNLSIELSGGSDVLDEVVITASRRAEKIQDSPSAISVINTSKLQIDNVANPMLSLRNTAGVDVAQYGVAEGNINLRGRSAVFSTETFVIADYRNLLIPSFGWLRYAQQPIDAIDLDRIEVVKGPGGALYGPGVEAGVVHFISKSPFAKQGTTISLGGGNQSQFQTAFRHAGIAKNEKLGYKIMGFFRTAKDFEVDMTDPTQADRLNSYPKQIVSAITKEPIADGALDYSNQALSMTGTLEYRFNPKTNLIAVAGIGQGSGIFRTPQGEGYTKAARPFAQLRFQSGGFFAQTFWSKNNATDGKSWIYATGLTSISVYNQLEGQAQYEFDPIKNKLNVIAGVDYRTSTIETEGTVNGRFEDQDDYLIYGSYLQAKYIVAPKIDLVAAARVDKFEALNEVAVSPRVGLVMKPHENHTFRITWNRAVGVPSSLQLNNDFAIANRGAFLVWLGAGSQPMTFGQNRYYNFVTQRTSDSPNLPLLAAYAAATNGLIGKLPKPVTDYLATLNAKITGVTAGVLASQPLSRENPIGLSSSDMLEFGYKGTIAKKLNITAEVYYNHRKNNLTPLQTASPLVVYPTAGQDLAAVVTAAVDPNVAKLFNLSPAAIGNIYKTAFETSSIGKDGKPAPLGLLSADQSPTGKTLDATYYNLESVDYWGADVSLIYNFNRAFSVFANGAYLSQNYWEAAKVKNSLTVVPFGLNIPAQRYRFGFDYIREKGIILNAAVRYSSAWTSVNGAVWSGELPAYTVVDAGIGYVFSPKFMVNFSGTNILDEPYKALANSPAIGRLMLLKTTLAF